MTLNLEKLYFKQGTKSYKWPKPSWCCCLHLFTTCSTSSLSTSSIIWGDSNPSGVKGGVEGEGGINKFSVTGPLLAAPPLVSAGAQKYFLLLKFRRTRLLKMISQGLSSSASNNFKVSMLTWKDENNFVSWTTLWVAKRIPVWAKKSKVDLSASLPSYGTALWPGSTYFAHKLLHLEWRVQLNLDRWNVAKCFFLLYN